MIKRRGRARALALLRYLLLPPLPLLSVIRVFRRRSRRRRRRGRRWAVIAHPVPLIPRRASVRAGVHGVWLRTRERDRLEVVRIVPHPILVVRIARRRIDLQRRRVRRVLVNVRLGPSHPDERLSRVGRILNVELSRIRRRLLPRGLRAVRASLARGESPRRTRGPRLACGRRPERRTYRPVPRA